MIISIVISIYIIDYIYKYIYISWLYYRYKSLFSRYIPPSAGFRRGKKWGVFCPNCHALPLSFLYFSDNQPLAKTCSPEAAVSTCRKRPAKTSKTPKERVKTPKTRHQTAPKNAFLPLNGCSQKASTILLALPAVFSSPFSSPFKYNSVYLSRIGDNPEMPEDVW